jgi:hypothetical protein
MSALAEPAGGVLVQGITGRQASWSVREMARYGTRIVGGVVPGRGGMEHEGVWSGHRHEPSLEPADPGDRPAVVEAHDEPHAHGHASGHLGDEPHDTGVPVTMGHEVGDADRSGVGLELGVEDQGPLPVAPTDPAHAAQRGEQPPPVGLVAQEGGEDRSGVEAGQAQPVDRPVVAHERPGVGVADHGVVLEPQRHHNP